MSKRGKTATQIVAKLQGLGYVASVTHMGIIPGIMARIPNGRTTSVYPPKLKTGP